MIKKTFFVSVALLTFNAVPIVAAQAGVKDTVSNWTNKVISPRNGEGHQPYLENERHLQIPQWADQNWYVEDWTTQKDGQSLIRGFYDADILRDQTVGLNQLPVLVVGPNFYHLSGLDKRRVATTVDTIYGITEKFDNASFMLTDWHTKRTIGVFDKHGLRLH